MVAKSGHHARHRNKTAHTLGQNSVFSIRTREHRHYPDDRRVGEEARQGHTALTRAAGPNSNLSSESLVVIEPGKNEPCRPESPCCSRMAPSPRQAEKNTCCVQKIKDDQLVSARYSRRQYRRGTRKQHGVPWPSTVQQQQSPLRPHGRRKNELTTISAVNREHGQTRMRVVLLSCRDRK